MSHIIYLSLGTNLGDRLKYLRSAITLLSAKVQVLTSSSIYETEPWGYTDQPAFLNLVIKGSTELDPQDLLTFLKGIETSMGRQETFRYGPRVIDLDILFYNDFVLSSPDLVIPHPRIRERAFVLVPMAEIAPDLIHPALGVPIQRLKAALDTSSIKLYQSPFT